MLYHIQIMNEVFKQRKNANKLYSLRAFARQLNLDSSSLGKMMRGERRFVKKHTKLILENLKLSETEETLFLESVEKQEAYFASRVDMYNLNTNTHSAQAHASV